MKLGVLTVPLGGMSLDEACRYLSERGVQMVEIGCGGYPGKAHCNAAELLADDAKRAKSIIENYEAPFASTAEYLAFMDSLARNGNRITYTEEGVATIDLT